MESPNVAVPKKSILKTGSIVMPGDVLLDVSSYANSTKKIIFGPGMRRDGDKIIITKCGVLKQNTAQVYYVDNHQMRVKLFSVLLV